MSLPLKPGVAQTRIGRYAVLMLFAALLQAPIARADDQPNPYTITVKVDATAANAVDARRMARLDGQRRALTQAVQQLAGSTDVKLPPLEDNAITNMVDSFEVANEHMSAVRYLADYTFHFHPAQVRRLMQQAGIAMAGSTPDNAPADNAPADNAPAGNGAGAGGTIAVILPVFEDGPSPVLWDDPNPWRDAWAQRPEGSAPVRLKVPLGGVDDLTAIDAPQALAGKSDALTAIAAHYGGGGVIVAVAAMQRQNGKLAGCAVTVKHYRQGELAGSQTETFSINPGESEADFITRAVAGTAAAIESGANEVAVGNGPLGSLTASVPITGLDEWVEVRDRLAAVPAVRKIELLSLNQEEARIEITYSGTSDELRTGLADADLALSGSDPTWQVRPADAANPR
jgi:hypothetical protein